MILLLLPSTVEDEGPERRGGQQPRDVHMRIIIGIRVGIRAHVIHSFLAPKNSNMFHSNLSQVGVETKRDVRSSGS